MPRPPRRIVGGQTYHVVNRGNERRVIYPQTADYEDFLERLIDGRQRAPVDLFGYCLMPNHFHLIVRPHTDTAVSEYMHWVCGRYACDLRARTLTVGHGHVFQRRFWSCWLHDEQYFLSALRYVEGNPRRANLVTRAQDWRWNSLTERGEATLKLLSPLPVTLPASWEALVNVGQDEALLARLRRAVCPPRR